MPNVWVCQGSNVNNMLTNLKANSAINGIMEILSTRVTFLHGSLPLRGDPFFLSYNRYMGLSPKRRAFVEAYLKTFNATQAAKEAGYSEKTAHSQGPRLLGFVDVAAEIKKRLDEMVMSADEVLRLLSRQATASHKSWIKVDNDGKIYFDFSDPEAQENIDLIKKIKTKTRHEREGKKDFEVEWVEVELYDSQRALELIGRHHQLFTDRVDLSTGGKPIDLTLLSDDQLKRLEDIIRAATNTRSDKG